MTSHGQCPRGVGGACECLPSGNPVSAPDSVPKFKHRAAKDKKCVLHFGEIAGGTLGEITHSWQ